MGNLGWIPGSGRSPGEGNGYPLQYSCLENSMNGGAWWATVHGVAKSWTRLSNFTFTLGLPWWLRPYRICLPRSRHMFHPWVGKNPGEGNDYSLQSSCPENSIDREACGLQSLGLQNSDMPNITLGFSYQKECSPYILEKFYITC